LQTLLDSPAVAETANRNTYDALISHHIDDSTSHVRSKINKMVTWSRKGDTCPSPNLFFDPRKNQASS